jgi:hypothetical protein
LLAVIWRRLGKLPARSSSQMVLRARVVRWLVAGEGPHGAAEHEGEGGDRLGGRRAAGERRHEGNARPWFGPPLWGRSGSGLGDGGEPVVARAVEAVHPDELRDSPPLAAAGDHHHQVDGIADEVRLGSGVGALRQAVEAVERGERVVGVERGDAAGVAGLPGIQEVEGCLVADLADDDAVGRGAQRRLDQSRRLAVKARDSCSVAA